MSALPALANFAFPLLIVVIQLVTNDHLRTQIRKELHVALDGWRIHSRHISNYARFSAMSSDNSKSLHFSPLPEDQLEWGPWLHQHIETANGFTIRIKNSNGKYETISYLSMYIMGYGPTKKIFGWQIKLTSPNLLRTRSLNIRRPPPLKKNCFLKTMRNCSISRMLVCIVRCRSLYEMQFWMLFVAIPFSRNST